MGKFEALFLFDKSELFFDFAVWDMLLVNLRVVIELQLFLDIFVVLAKKSLWSHHKIYVFLYLAFDDDGWTHFVFRIAFHLFYCIEARVQKDFKSYLFLKEFPSFCSGPKVKINYVLRFVLLAVSIGSFKHRVYLWNDLKSLRLVFLKNLFPLTTFFAIDFF